MSGSALHWKNPSSSRHVVPQSSVRRQQALPCAFRHVCRRRRGVLVSSGNLLVWGCQAPCQRILCTRPIGPFLPWLSPATLYCHGVGQVEGHQHSALGFHIRTCTWVQCATNEAWLD